MGVRSWFLSTGDWQYWYWLVWRLAGGQKKPRNKPHWRQHTQDHPVQWSPGPASSANSQDSHTVKGRWLSLSPICFSPCTRHNSLAYESGIENSSPYEQLWAFHSQHFRNPTIQNRHKAILSREFLLCHLEAILWGWDTYLGKSSLRSFQKAWWLPRVSEPWQLRTAPLKGAGTRSDTIHEEELP